MSEPDVAIFPEVMAVPETFPAVVSVGTSASTIPAPANAVSLRI